MMMMMMIIRKKDDDDALIIILLFVIIHPLKVYIYINIFDQYYNILCVYGVLRC